MITATVKHFLEHLIITQLQENNRENKHTTLQVKKKKKENARRTLLCRHAHRIYTSFLTEEKSMASPAYYLHTG